MFYQIGPHDPTLLMSSHGVGSSGPPRSVLLSTNTSSASVMFHHDGHVRPRARPCPALATMRPLYLASTLPMTSTLLVLVVPAGFVHQLIRLQREPLNRAPTRIRGAEASACMCTAQASCIHLSAQIDVNVRCKRDIYLRT